MRGKKIAIVAPAYAWLPGKLGSLSDFFIERNWYGILKPHRQDCREEFSGMVNVIVTSQQIMDKYKRQIQDIKGIRCCEQCGFEVQIGVAFCSSCGNPMPEVLTQKMMMTI